MGVLEGQKHYIADKMDFMVDVKIRKGWDHGKRPVMTTRDQCNRESLGRSFSWFLAYFSRNKLGVKSSRFVMILNFSY